MAASASSILKHIAHWQKAASPSAVGGSHHTLPVVQNSMAAANTASSALTSTTTSASRSSIGISGGRLSAGIWNIEPDLVRIETTVRDVKAARTGEKKQTSKVAPARETLYNDIVRIMAQPIVWDPAACRIPNVPLGEPVDPEYMDGYLQRPMDWEELCIRNTACLGLVLAIAFRGKGYVLGRFTTPRGRQHAGLCIMCLRLALTQNDNLELGRFQVVDYVLEDEEWKKFDPKFL